MIDTTRWLLVEAWLSLGLRMRWAAAHEQRNHHDPEWQRDEDTDQSFLYAGGGVWMVARPHDWRRAPGFPMEDVPNLGSAAMRHELAHYMVASEDQRTKVNFGLTQADTADEERAVLAEQVVDAMTRASRNLVGSILAGARR